MNEDIASKPTVCGTGSESSDLTADELLRIVAEALESVPSNARVLAIVPDKTRDDNTHILFPAAAHSLSGKGISSIDVLVAQGTHPAMTTGEKLAKIGADRSQIPNLGQIYDHEWNDPDKLTNIGELTANEVHKLTNGVLSETIPLTVNRLVGDGLYDVILIFGATMPHEVAGFAGGAKYIFPGISGPELTHKTHWLGALTTIKKTIGRIETPTRHLIEAAADQVKARIIAFTSVISRTETNKLRTHALFAGDHRASLRRAAEVSRRVHIKYTGRKYSRVVALLDDHYRDMWVGGKASYRLGGIIEDGGELIIYAPHLDRISETHESDIIRFGGYAPLEIIKERVRTSEDLRSNLCIAAHLAHVSYAGRTDAASSIRSKYQITLASQVDRKTCEQVNLTYLDPKDLDLNTFRNDPNTLIVERAGKDLYLVEPHDD